MIESVCVCVGWKGGRTRELVIRTTVVCNNYAICFARGDHLHDKGTVAEKKNKSGCADECGVYQTQSNIHTTHSAHTHTQPGFADTVSRKPIAIINTHTHTRARTQLLLLGRSVLEIFVFALFPCSLFGRFCYCLLALLPLALAHTDTHNC